MSCPRNRMLPKRNSKLPVFGKKAQFPTNMCKNIFLSLQLLKRSIQFLSYRNCERYSEPIVKFKRADNFGPQVYKNKKNIEPELCQGFAISFGPFPILVKKSILSWALEFFLYKSSSKFGPEHCSDVARRPVAQARSGKALHRSNVNKSESESQLLRPKYCSIMLISGCRRS